MPPQCLECLFSEGRWEECPTLSGYDGKRDEVFAVGQPVGVSAVVAGVGQA